MRLPIVTAGLLALCAAIPLTAVPLAAQDVQPVPSPAKTAVDWTPTIKPPAGEEAITLASARYEVTVRGLFAETTVTFVFRNPNPRALAGDLDVPLPDGATVCGYALDIGGRMVDGVVVGKDQGRIILESEQRHRVDPGLVEAVRGNSYRTRIFPLPAQGTRTVRLTWTSELTVNGDEAAARIALPRVALPALDIKLDIAAGAVEPVLGGFGNLALTRWHDSHVAEAHLTDVTPGDDLLIRLPNLPPRLVMVEERQGEHFLAIAETPGKAVAVEESPVPPKRVAVAWDASGSRTPAGISAGRAVLTELLKRWPGTVLDVVAFRDVPDAPVACADAAALGHALDAVVYDGGTALGQLDLRRAALPQAQDEAWILVSDGLGTITGATGAAGDAAAEGLPACGDVPVHCVASETVRDAAMLRLIAARTGGQVVDAISDAPARAAERIAAPAPGLLRVEAADGVISDVQIGHCQDRSLVLARLVGDGDVNLIYGVPGAAGEKHRITVHRTDAVTGDTVPRAWAGARAEDLGVCPGANADRLVALGRTYGIVTPATSLIVLENLDQYLRHGVEPPATLPDLRDQYFAMLKQRGDVRDRIRANAIDNLARIWQERVDFWNRPDAGKAIAMKDAAPGNGVFGVTGHAGGGNESAPVAAPSSPAPAPVRAVAANERDDLADEAAADRPVGQAEAASAIGGSGTFDAVDNVRAKAGGGRAQDGVSGAIAISAFDPDTPYLRTLAAVPPGQAYATYLDQRATHSSSPSFYLDCASFFLTRDPRIGHRVLSNLAELRLDDPGLLRVYAWRLQQAADLDGAVAALREVLRLRPEEPQSYRDLGLALAARGEATKKAADIEEAMGLLLRVATHQPVVGVGSAMDSAIGSDIDQGWQRFPDADLIALEELNRLIAAAERGGFDRTVTAPVVDPRLKGNLDDDVRVVMSWDQDATDIDLHVREPGGDEGFYGHRFTTGGGMVSHDCTQGYGPEEYVLHRAATGSYQITCKFYGSHVQTLYGPVTVVATVYLDWGRATERKQVMTLRLDQPHQDIEIGTVHLDGHDAVASDTAKANAVTDIANFGSTAAITAGTVPRATAMNLLRKGQSRDAVEAILGAPLRVDGGGVTVLIYRLDNGNALRLGLGPDLIWGREVTDGAERDLVRN